MQSARRVLYFRLDFLILVFNGPLVEFIFRCHDLYEQRVWMGNDG